VCAKDEGGVQVHAGPPAPAKLRPPAVALRAACCLARGGVAELLPIGPRVYLTVCNRLGYRGNQANQTGPVTVPTGYQPVVFKNFGFEFKKLKNEEKFLKVLHDLLSLMVSIFSKLRSFSIMFGQYKLNQDEKRKNVAAQQDPLRPHPWGGQNTPHPAPPHSVSAAATTCPLASAPVHRPQVAIRPSAPHNRPLTAVYRSVSLVSRSAGGSTAGGGKPSVRSVCRPGQSVCRGLGRFTALGTRKPSPLH
jgi:hypothetical protein